VKAKLFFAILLTSLLCWPAMADFLTVTNGDFESWTVNGTGGPPDNWTNDNSGFTSTQEGTTVHGGTYSVNLTWTSSSNQDFVSDMIAVTAGELYTISAWMYDNDAQGRLRLCFEWYDVAQDYISASYSGSYSEDAGAWTEYTYATNAVATAAYCKILIRQYDVSPFTAATVYVDDVTLFEGFGANLPPEFGSIYANPYPLAFGNVAVEANITDLDGTIADDSLYYQTSTLLVYTPVYHDSIVGGEDYWYTIPSQAVGTFVEYYVQAEDDDAERIESSVFDYTVETAGPTGSGLNFGFEDWDDNGVGGPPDDWFKTTADLTATQEGTTVHGGTYSNNLTWTSTSTQSLTSNPIYVTGGQTYACSLYVYDFDPYGRVRVIFRSDDGNSYPSTYSTDIDAWQKLDYTWLAPENATWVVVQLAMYDVSGFTTDATVYVDDVYLTEVEAVPDTIPIYDLQYTTTIGAGCYDSPYYNEIVTTIGVVSGLYNGMDTRFAIQDASSSLWSGIYCHDAGSGVAVGDSVAVTGQVNEYYGFGQIVSPSVTVLGTGTAVAPLVITTADLGSQGCDPDAEAYEGVWLRINNVTIIGGPSSGDYWGQSGTGDSCYIQDNGYDDGVALYDDLPLTVGYTYEYLVGIGYYAYDHYRLAPTNPADIGPVVITEAPVIANVTQDPPTVVEPTDNVIVTAEITDDGTITKDSLYVRLDGGAWAPIAHDALVPPTYSYTIGTNVEGTFVEYYIIAEDDEATPNRTETSIFSYTVTAMQLQTIAEIQFNDTDPGGEYDCYPSPDTGNIVMMTGVVSAAKYNDSYNRFYFQDADSLWSGMYGYVPVTAPEVDYEPVIGDSITVTGLIAEYYTVTECDGPTVTVHGTAAPYAPVIVTSDDIPPDTCDVVGESYESMLVKLENVLCVVSTVGSEAWVKSDGDADSCVISSYIFGPPPLPNFIAGQRYNVTGIVAYYNYRFLIYPRDGADVEIIPPDEPVIGNVVQDPPGSLIDPAASVGVSANIVDYQGTVDKDSLYVRLNGGAWAPIAHDALVPPTYSYTIGTNVEGTFVEYYIIAEDNEANRAETDIYSYTATDYEPLCADDIYDIQFTVDASAWPECYPSPLFETAVDICGIVTGAKLDSLGSCPETKFFVQVDDDDLWNGVYVFDYGYVPLMRINNGDEVEVFGTVDEYNGLTEVASVTDIRILSSSNPGPAPLNTKLREFESDCSFATEPYEGVLVKLTGVTVLSGSGGYFWVTDTTTTDSVQITNYLYYNYDECDLNPPVAEEAYYDSVFGCMYWYGHYSDPDAGYWRIYPRCGTDFYSDMEPIGACCVEAVCVATNTETECDGLTGEWFIGESCDDFECPGGCYEYLPGDVNMSGGTWPPGATGPDVTYLVNFFRGVPTSVPCKFDGELGLFWASADANGDCNIIGSDVTKMVNVFRGIGGMQYCGDGEGDPASYEPCWPTAPDIPGTMPDGWPNCE